MTDDTESSAVADLVAALWSLEDPKRTGQVSAGQRSYRFMELGALLETVRRTFGQHGWAITQPTTVADGQVTVSNVWLHRSGETITHPPFTLPCGRAPQDIGSAITYARRYSLAALVGLAGSDDDDAQRAMTTPRIPDNQPAPPPTQPDGVHGDTRPGTASPASIKLMWTLLRQTGMDTDHIRGWAAEVLTIDPDWSTTDLSQHQVSTLINRLKEEPPAPSPADA